MKQILKKQLGLSKAAKCIIALLVLAVLLGSGLLFWFLQNHVRNVAFAEEQRNVHNISELNAAAIRHELESRHTLLRSIVDSLSQDRTYEPQPLLSKLTQYKLNYNFYNMGLLLPDGTFYTTDGGPYQIGQYPLFQQALQGEEVLSHSIPAVDNASIKVNVMTVPFYQNGALSYVFVASYRSDILAQTLNLSAFNGKGYSFLVNSSGHAVVYGNETADSTFSELLRFIDDSPELSPADDEACLFFDYNGQRYYAHFEALGISDWYLMTCAPEHVVFAGTYNILRETMLSMGLLWGLVLFAALVIAVVYWRYRRKTQRIVFFDPLLERPNYESLKVYLSALTPRERESMAFFVLDVDKFKEFNFLYGSERGDELLRYLDRSFREELPQDFLVRQAADQFAGLLHSANRCETEGKLDRLLHRFEQDIRNKEVEPFEVSIGICRLADYDTVQVMFSDALIAKNTIKNDRVLNYAFYDEQMRHKRMNEVRMESEFAGAVENNEFQVYYQPKINSSTGKIVGAEALVRWKKPDGSMVSPGEFIPCFENNGQIIKLDEVILTTVCRQMKAMERDGLPVVPVSINLSRVHLRYPGIAAKIAQIIDEMRIDPTKLSFEITESALYEDSIPLKDIVSRIHALGCQVDMDDYGTGVSGPNSLANNSFDVLKLDKSFVDKLGDSRMQVVISSTIQMAQQLGMTLIAEGVETSEQVQQLQALGCYLVQGFYYSRPLPEADYRALLASDKLFPIH